MLFCFIKTNNSFHGVEKMVMEETDRWLLLFDIFLSEKSYLNEKEAKEKYLKEKNSWGVNFIKILSLIS